MRLKISMQTMSELNLIARYVVDVQRFGELCASCLGKHQRHKRELIIVFPFIDF